MNVRDMYVAEQVFGRDVKLVNDKVWDHTFTARRRLRSFHSGDGMNKILMKLKIDHTVQMYNIKDNWLCEIFIQNTLQAKGVHKILSYAVVEAVLELYKPKLELVH